MPEIKPSFHEVADRLLQLKAEAGFFDVKRLTREETEAVRALRMAHYRHELPLDIVERLTAAGYSLVGPNFLSRKQDLVDARWEFRFTELSAFHGEYGHANVPQLDPKYRDLGLWVTRQRKALRDGKMPQDRAARLGTLGVIADSQVPAAEERLRDLEAFVATHGRLPAYEEDAILMNWANRNLIRNEKLLSKASPSLRDCVAKAADAPMRVLGRAKRHAAVLRRYLGQPACPGLQAVPFAMHLTTLSAGERRALQDARAWLTRAVADGKAGIIRDKTGMVLLQLVLEHPGRLELDGDPLAEALRRADSLHEQLVSLRVAHARQAQALPYAPAAQVPPPRYAGQPILISEAPGLSVRARNALRAEGFNTLQDVANKLTTDALFGRIPQVGEKSAREIVAVLRDHGMELEATAGSLAS